MKCWIVTEGLAGTENQCLGVAEALGVHPDVKRINLRQPWRIFSPYLGPYLGFECHWTFTGHPLTPPWPDLLLASGRKAVAAARYIQKQSAGHTFIAVLQDPRIDPAAFDLVAVPAHDKVRGDNVFVTDAAPNRITAQRLADARTEFAPLFSGLSAPRVAVLIGGSSKTHDMTPDTTARLADDLRTLAETGYSLMVTMSRRTGQQNTALLTGQLRHENIYIWDGTSTSTSKNPYFGMLAWADFIMVTADSVSMIAEAATTGTPAYVITLPGGNAKFDRFYDHLHAKGVLRPFDGSLDAYDYEPLNDAARVAGEIRKRMTKSEN